MGNGKFVYLFAILFLISFIIIIPIANGQIYHRTQTPSSSATFSFGPLDIHLTYFLDLDITMPKKITAGTSEEVRISPSNGVLQTTFVFQGTSFGPYTNSINLGQQKDIALDVPLISVYAKPVINAFPSVSGPGYASPQSIPFTSMTTKTVQIHVNDDIGRDSSVRLQIPITLFLEVGAAIDIPFILTESYPVETFEMSKFSTVSESIPIQKFVNTKLNLQVSSDNNSKYLKVKPSLTANGSPLYDYDVKIYVDDQYKQNVQSSRWSENIWADYGTHTIKAEFQQTSDKSNNAIIYKSSNDFESHTLKKSSTSSSSSSKQPSDLKCGSGTHEENGECVPDPLFGGGCLIATATYGSELALQVQQLREIRDNTLLQTESGSTFMAGFNQFYYSFSPTIADWERENPVFKETVKLAITPLLTSLSILNYVNIDSEAEVLGYGISLILLNLMMYVGIPIFAITRFRKW